MIASFSNLVPYLFYFLFFFAPLVLFPKTSELFEFNKMVLTYTLTVLIVSSWLTKIILEKKIIFRRTPLDIPLIIFLGSQILSTVTSVDLRTSIFGYYSRFHGGLLSSFSYSLLFWAYVSNMDREKTLKSLYFLLTSCLLVSMYGVAQHFGIDKDVWVQEVQTRVFSTLGQPNWLAAWIVALTPITWALALNSKFNTSDVFQSAPRRSKLWRRATKLQFKIQNFWLWFTLSGLFFLTLLYTKSRSGLLGFVVADLVFWSGTVFSAIRQKMKMGLTLKRFLILHFAFLILALVSGTWTSSIRKLTARKPQPVPARQPNVLGTALETGGTESGEIRKIVWKGTLDIWKNYPILGTGVETFAFSYYNFRPPEHNMVSEWNYLYNKAHNEFLNLAANTGIVGLASYLLLTGASFFIFIKKLEFPISNLPDGKAGFQFPIRLKNKNSEHAKDLSHITFHLSLLAGYSSILVTNFFGFSVVPVALQFFLYPAIAASLSNYELRVTNYESRTLSISQKVIAGTVFLLASYFLLLISRYWYADYLYAKGKLENDSKNYVEASKILTKAIELSPNESIFWQELSEATTNIAVSLNEAKDEKQAQEFAGQAYAASQKAVELSPANVNLRRRQANLSIELSKIEPGYLYYARETLMNATELAPTDAQLFYNLALADIRLGQNKKAIETLKKTVELKPDYRNAWFGLALLYVDEGENEKAKATLKYILEDVSPDDAQVLKELKELEAGD